MNASVFEDGIVDAANQKLTKAFVAKVVAADGSEDELEALMVAAVELANQEEGTIVWFSVKTDDRTFWVFDAFVDEAGQQAHANGQIVAALQANSRLLGAEPEILPADILATKMP